MAKYLRYSRTTLGHSWPTWTSQRSSFHRFCQQAENLPRQLDYSALVHIHAVLYWQFGLVCSWFAGWDDKTATEDIYQTWLFAPFSHVLMWIWHTSMLLSRTNKPLFTGAKRYHAEDLDIAYLGQLPNAKITLAFLPLYLLYILPLTSQITNILILWNRFCERHAFIGKAFPFF